MLEQGYPPCAVYTQPDRPAGRGKKLLASPVKQLAETHRIPVLQPPSLKQDADIAQLAELAPDVMIVAAYGLLLPQRVLEIPRLGCINIHASLLPRWRGAAPIQRAIQAGDHETGITIMRMAAGLDTGNMLIKQRLPISEQDTGGSLHDKLAALGAKSILEYLAQAEQFGPGEQQDETQSCYAAKLNKDEAELDWQQSAQQLERTVRAFNPWPMAYTSCGEERVRILAADARPTVGAAQPPGTVIRREREGIDVACGTGVLRILQLQLPGGKPLSCNDLINGNRPHLALGQRLLKASS